jgi:hypothetical protein
MTALFPVAMSVTFATVPSGRVRLAALLPRGFIGAPFAMALPKNRGA